MSYAVEWTEPALALLAEITDKRIQRKLLEVADELATDPDKRGWPLAANLAGYWSLHWSRYRVIYLMDDEAQKVYALAAGMRQEGKPRDIYELARRLLRRGLLEPPSE